MKNSGAYHRRLVAKREEILRSARELAEVLRKSKRNTTRSLIVRPPPPLLSTVVLNNSSYVNYSVNTTTIPLPSTSGGSIDEPDISTVNMTTIPQQSLTSSTFGNNSNVQNASECDRDRNESDISCDDYATYFDTATLDESSFIFHESDDDDDDDGQSEYEKNQVFRTAMRKWAVEHKITHLALKDLLKIINTRIDNKNSNVLPDDPRTLLQTPQSITITSMSNGEYWHYGVKNGLKLVFRNLEESIDISLNINIDGLPIFKSSKTDFWPILFNIREMPNLRPMIIGIFCGTGKCSDVVRFLSPMVEEMNEIIMDGVYINSHKISVSVNCFICDSPARAFVKSMFPF